MYIGRTPAEFAAGIRQALAEDTAQRRAARRQCVAAETWDAKANLIMNEIQNLEHLDYQEEKFSPPRHQDTKKTRKISRRGR